MWDLYVQHSINNWTLPGDVKYVLFFYDAIDWNSLYLLGGQRHKEHNYVRNITSEN